MLDRNPVHFNTAACSTVVQLVKDLVLYQNVEDAIKCLKPICEASNVMQSNNSSVADGLEAWKGVLKSFRDLGAEGREWLEKAKTRYNCSVPAVWFVASILHPKYRGANLTPMEWRTARKWIADEAPEHLAGFTDYVGGESKDAVKAAYESAPGCKLHNFIRAQKQFGAYPDNLADLCEIAAALVPSSAGIERVFSSMGFVHSDLRNRLFSEKVAKLAFCLRAVNL